MFNTLEEIKSYIAETFGDAYDDVILYSSPDYAPAFLGITDNHLAVYDYALMLEFLVAKEDMSMDEAVEFIDYNNSYRQEGQPLILNKV